MSKMLHFKAFVIPILFFIITAEIASFHAPDGFSRMDHSFSQLGAQALQTAWIMNTTWIGFGTLIVVVVLGYHHKEDLPQAMTFPMVVFGISVTLLGIWRSENLVEEMIVNVEEASDHLIFYSVVIISFLVGVILHGVLSQSKTLKKIHYMTAGIVLCFAMILQLTTTFHGLYERFLWGIMLIWIVSLYGRVDTHGNVNRL